MTPERLKILVDEARKCADEAERLAGGDHEEARQASRTAAQAVDRVMQARACAARIRAELWELQQRAEAAAARIMRARQLREEADSRPRAPGLRPAGECAYCDELHERGETFFPPHAASSNCRSGRRPHCTCDMCF